MDVMVSMCKSLNHINIKPKKSPLRGCAAVLLSNKLDAFMFV